MGTISSHRKVRVVAVEKYTARGSEMRLVEDAEEVGHDEEADCKNSQNTPRSPHNTTRTVQCRATASRADQIVLL